MKLKIVEMKNVVFLELHVDEIKLNKKERKGPVTRIWDESGGRSEDGMGEGVQDICAHIFSKHQASLSRKKEKEKKK